MYLGTSSHGFFVLPAEKQGAFTGRLGVGAQYYYRDVSALFLTNVSYVWLIGGSRYVFRDRFEMQVLEGEEYHTNILNLKYDTDYYSASGFNRILFGLRVPNNWLNP